MNLHGLLTRVSVAAMAALLAREASAHHPMGGATPASLLQGLLSGLGHPLIEPAHALFLVGAAVLVAVSGTRPRLALPLMALHVLCSALGVLLASWPGTSTPTPWLVGASLIILAPAVGLRRLPTPPLRWSLAAATGLAHGLAFGEAVIGAEPTPVLAYLAGLGLMQAAVLTAICLGTRRLLTSASARVDRGIRVLAGGLLTAGVAVVMGVL